MRTKTILAGKILDNNQGFKDINLDYHTSIAKYYATIEGALSMPAIQLATEHN
jgi:hypothetical protein